MELVKVIFNVLNVLVFLIGVGFIGVGIYMYVSDRTLITHPYDDTIRNGALVGAAGGFITMATALAGLVGFNSGSYRLQIVYASGLVLVAIVFTVIGCFGIANYEVCQESLKVWLTYCMKEYDKDELLKQRVDDIQEEFKCCGMTDFSFDKYPLSCCPNVTAEQKECQKEHAYPDTCDVNVVNVPLEMMPGYCGAMIASALAFGLVIVIGSHVDGN